MARESERPIRPGEAGENVDVFVLKMDFRYEKYFNEFGFSGLTSDQISPDRSIKDLRQGRPD